MLAGAVNFGDGKNFGSGTRQTGTAFYGFLSLWMGGSRCKSTAPTSSGRTATFSRALINVAEAFELAKQLADGHDVELWQLDRQFGTVKARGQRDNFTPAVHAP